MATAQLGKLVRNVRNLAAGNGSLERADRQLLDDFSACRDEAAFAALVARHGSMVLRVCRRLLNHEQDAEDAFQATFLILARKSASIRKTEALAQWLHGVAYRTALEVKRSAARRRGHEARLWTVMRKAAVSPTWDDVQAVLDEEIQRLRAPFRVAFVLCVLEGKSGPQAAAEMGVKEGTVRSRLGRARQLLQQRLARRGIKLSALLAALSVVEGAGRASVPAALVGTTLRFGLLVAAGNSAAGVIPTHIAALAAGVTRAMFVTKTKIAVAALLAIGLFAAGASIVGHQALAAPESRTSATPQETESRAKQQAGPAADDAKEGTIEVTGRVVDPAGKPVQGATIYYMRHMVLRVRAYHFEPLSPPPPAQATSGADGSFHFRIAGKGFESADEEKHWFHITLTAVAAGHGPGWKAVDKPEALKDVTLKLVKDDVPIEGRVVDLEGHPIPGATVRVLGFGANASEDLKPWLDAIQKQKELVHGDHYPGNGLDPAVVGLTKPVVTAADGKFRITGIGRERVVELRFEGPGIETRDVYAMTHQGPTVEAPHSKESPAFGRFLLYGASIEYAGAPTRPVVGVVRDKDTGKPLAGAIIEAEIARAGASINGRIANGVQLLLPDGGRQIRTTTDQEGRYRLVGLPKLPWQGMMARLATDQPYLPSLHRAPAGEALNPVTLNFELKRGVRIRGRVTNKETKQPMPAVVEYFIFANESGAALVREVDSPGDLRARTAKDGSFSLVGLPGRGLLAAKAASGDGRQYLTAVGADAIPGLERGRFITFPFTCDAGSHNTVVEIKPLKETALLVQDIEIDPGKTVTGKFVGPDGEPVAGVHVGGSSQDFPTAEFRIRAVDPQRPKTLYLFQYEKKLAMALHIKGDESKPLTVKLQKCATLTGRLLDQDGEPRAGVELSGKNVDANSYGFFGGQKTDKDGRFKIEGIMPGVKVGLATSTPGSITGTVVQEVTLKAGETKDLGDVRAKPLQ
jgi:RNA polymerase sigma factor (sigma-70 family)